MSETSKVCSFQWCKVFCMLYWQMWPCSKVALLGAKPYAGVRSRVGRQGSPVKIGLKPGNRSTWESHKCSGTQWEQFINTETNLLAWNTMRAVEELSLCPGIVEGAQNAAITEELYRRSPRRQKKRKKKLQVQPCIGWSSNYWSYGLGKKCYRVLEYYRVHI